jgi:hypothetical protein
MFSFIYTMLFAIWIYVFNHKIQAGPQPVFTGPPGKGPGKTLEGWERSTAARTVHDDSMSEAKDKDDSERGA